MAKSYFFVDYALLVACWTNNRKVVGSKPAKGVCNHSVDR